MVIFSRLSNTTKPLAVFCRNAVIQREMSGHGPRVLPFRPSRFQWNKFKDFVHLYFFVGAIPLAIITASANIFVGPATLSEIPKDYVPKYWEYYRSPITRFIAKYFMNNPQQEYEKLLHHVHEAYEKKMLRELERKIKAKMAERRDYKAYYYRPIPAKYHRVSREAADEIEELRGD